MMEFNNNSDRNYWKQAFIGLIIGTILWGIIYQFLK